MSRLNEKIKKAQLNVAVAQERLELKQSRLEYLESKKRQYNRKRDRKQHRKRMRDPIYAMKFIMSKRLARQMYTDRSIILGQEFNGISKQIVFPKFGEY